eukprot:674401-Pyramimonas_sp.AAC.1
MIGGVCVRPSVGALVCDPWAVEVLVRDVSAVFETFRDQFAKFGPESAIWCDITLRYDGEEIAFDQAFNSCVDDAVRKII